MSDISDKIFIAVKDSDTLKKLLDSESFIIEVAKDISNVIDEIEKFLPDLIIMQTNLKNMNGYDICYKLKQNEKTQHIIILLLTEENNAQERIKASIAGADDLLEKDFDSLVLISKIKSLMRIKYLRIQLQEKYLELEEQNKIIAKQLEMAQNLQKLLIPEINLETEKIVIYSKYLPAMYIGGDFYDVIKLKEDRFCIIIGDVSGHGISAALLTAMLTNMIKNIVKSSSKPNKILDKLNKEFISAVNTNEIYACVFVAIIDTTAKKIFYSNAGQPIPIFISNNETHELFSSGTPVGLMNDSVYESKSINYENGDKIFFHTDGLADNFCKNDPEKFSNELKKILAKKSINVIQIAQNVLEKFYYNIEGNRYEFDDASLIICKLI